MTNYDGIGDGELDEAHGERRRAAGGLTHSATFARMGASGVLAVLVVDDAAVAVPLARALLAGGVDAMELTLRTPAALDALRAIVAEVPQMLAGIGTILTPEQAREAKHAGAAFGVSPGVNPRVVQAAQDAGLAFAPGICTPSDVEAALELGCANLKFFPAAQFGGLPYLNAMAAPYLHLGVRFIPLGGVGPKNLAEYLADPLVLAVGGSWLAPRDVIRRGDWHTVTDAAAAARKVLDEVRG